MNCVPTLRDTRGGELYSPAHTVYIIIGVRFGGNRVDLIGCVVQMANAIRPHTSAGNGFICANTAVVVSLCNNCEVGHQFIEGPIPMHTPISMNTSRVMCRVVR